MQACPLHPSAGPCWLAFFPWHRCSPFSPALQTQPTPAQPGPVKSPAHGSLVSGAAGLVSGVAARSRFCSLAEPIHGPWLRPRETRRHCSLSEADSSANRDLKGQGKRGEPSRKNRTGEPVCPSRFCCHSSVLSGPMGKLSQSDVHPFHSPELRPSSSGCVRGTFPPLQPLLCMPPVLALQAFHSWSSLSAAGGVGAGFAFVPFPPARLKGGTCLLHLDLAHSSWPIRHMVLLRD